MGAFKKFNTQDVYVSTYTANKNWTVSGSQYPDYGVLNIPAEYKGKEQYIVNTSHNQKGYNKRLALESIKHLYYTAFENGEITTSSSYDNFLQSSFNISGSRYLNNVASIYSLPKGVYGTAIKPESIEIKPDNESEEYVVDGYEADHIESLGTLYSSMAVFNPNGLGGLLDVDDPDPGYLETIVDDGEGNLFLKNRITGQPLEKKIGNVIYPQGQIIITDEIIASYYSNYIDGQITWKSTHPIYTYNFHCKLKESEFTHTYNPSALDGTNGDVAENVAGEEFSPYFTTIGLYNDSNELIAIAKPGQPVPIPKDTDMTVVVKLDI